MDQLLRDDAKKDMAALIQKVKAEVPGAVFKEKIIKGDAVPIIVSLGDSGNYDFIVMGTNGASGLKEVFIGSVAGGVISKTDAPVFVVPGTYEYQPLDEIIFAIGDMTFSEPSVVEPLRKIAQLSSGKVNVLHMADTKTPDLDNVLEMIDDLSPSVTYAFGEGNINVRLNDYMEGGQAELLCLVRQKRNFFARLFNESVTLKQTFQSNYPLLIIHD